MYRRAAVEADGCRRHHALLVEWSCFPLVSLIVTVVVRGGMKVVMQFVEEPVQGQCRYLRRAFDWVKEEWQDPNVEFWRRYYCDFHLGPAGEGGVLVKTCSAGCRCCRG